MLDEVKRRLYCKEQEEKKKKIALDKKTFICVKADAILAKIDLPVNMCVN